MKVGRSIPRKPIKHLVTIHTMLDILVPFFLFEKGKANWSVYNIQYQVDVFSSKLRFPELNCAELQLSNEANISKLRIM